MKYFQKYIQEYMYSELLYEGFLKGDLKSHLSRPSSFAIVLGHKLGKLNEDVCFAEAIAGVLVGLSESE